MRFDGADRLDGGEDQDDIVQCEEGKDTIDEGGDVKQDTPEHGEYVVSLGLSVSKEQMDRAREGLSETEGEKGLELARVDLERWPLFRENCLGEFFFEMDFWRDREWRVETSKKSSEGILVRCLMGRSSLVRAIIFLVERN